MDFVSSAQDEQINNPSEALSCDDNAAGTIDSGSQGNCGAKSDETDASSLPINDRILGRVRHSTTNSAEVDEGCWLQENEECEFDLLDGISDISVDSADYPTPAPKITLRTIAQRWLDKLVDEKNESNVNRNEEVQEPKTDPVISDQVDRYEVAVIPDTRHNKELNKSEEAPHLMTTNCSNNSVLPQPANSTYTLIDDIATDSNAANSQSVPTSQDTGISHLQIPSVKTVASEPMICGEVAVIRECCNSTFEMESPSIAGTHKGSAMVGANKPAANTSDAMVKKKGHSIKPMNLTRKMPIKKNIASMAKTPTKTSRIVQNSNQSHLTNKELKLPKSSCFKQKESLAIKKSLLSKPIVVSKQPTAKAENTMYSGPYKPAGLKRSISKVNAPHPLHLSTIPGHSTPVKEQAASRRRSVAVSPQRDSSEATNDKMMLPTTKQRRRSGIPLPGGMARDLKVPMSPRNKNDDHEVKGTTLGMSPIVSSKHHLRPAKARQLGLPKPKTQLNFNTSFDILEGVDLDGPPPGGSKLVHSPAEKENTSDAVHSQWSPIKRNKGITADEECIRCTKHTANIFSH